MEMDFLAVGAFTHRLPSGLIIASDIEEGLYVLQPNYMRGAYLEGSVRDASNNQTISGVDVTILGPNETTQTEYIWKLCYGFSHSRKLHCSLFTPFIPKRYGIQCTSSK